VALSALLADDSFLPASHPDDTAIADVAVLDGLDPAEADRVKFLYRHVHELAHGQQPPDPDTGLRPEPRPEYALTNPLQDRVRAKLAELAETSRPLQERALRKHLSSFRKQGIVGLVDKRKQRVSSPTGSLEDEVVALVRAEIAAQTFRSTGAVRRSIQRVREQSRDAGLHVYSLSTLYRVFDSLSEGLHTYGDATLRRTKAASPRRHQGSQTPLRPGELMEIDSTPLDVLVICPDGKPRRPDLTVLLDVCTNTVCAAILRPVATKSVDVASVLLAQALTPTVKQPGWPDRLAYARATLPQPDEVPDEALRVPSDDELAPRLANKPLIVPESITVDRGKVYIGNTFTAACERLQISIPKANPRTGSDKPHIERFFRALNTMFCQHLPGYVGSNITDRGEDPAREKLLTIDQVQTLLDLFILMVWQESPRDGLVDPAAPGHKLTPNEKYATVAGVAPTIARTLDDADRICLLPYVWRKPQLYGVNLHGLRYTSPELSQLFLTTTGPHERWQVRWHPYHMGTIWVHDPVHDQWVAAAWRGQRYLLAPFSGDMLMAAKKAVQARFDAGDRATDDLETEWAREVARMQSGGAANLAEEQAVVRHQHHENTTTWPLPSPTDAAQSQPESQEDDEDPPDGWYDPMVEPPTSTGHGVDLGDDIVY
ncbi:MAG: Mu transposase C-terminal domain-containing protein, partial [Actinobacteria bacterium]|nr:Mu transposase C-terminal domain-containing protein [Actinomycetota bacterium]